MLFIIDMQNDFVDQNRGKMAVKNADKLVPLIIEKIKEYEEKKDIIFYTLNIHEDMEDDKRNNNEKQWGQEIYPLLYEKLIHHNPIEKVYYGIPPEQAMKIKKKYANKKDYIKKIELVGVETHICLLSNAIILQNVFPDAEIIINRNLCISSDLKWHKKALKLMEELNMGVINNEIK